MDAVKKDWSNEIRKDFLQSLKERPTKFIEYMFKCGYMLTMKDVKNLRKLLKNK